ncbi:MAG TPA: phosphotransferase [Acidobacteriota bacterium]|nr:phosphotransferase [Acidobacteriota bacterium]
MPKEEKERARAEKRAHSIILHRLGVPKGDYILEPMAEGASSKRFFRIFFTRAGSVSVVLMLLGGRFRVEKTDYYQINELMRKLNLPVAAIYESYGRDGAMLLEDLGTTTLYDLANDLEGDEETLEEFYRQAIDSLVLLQTRSGRYSEGVAAFQRAFDERKLGWELGFMMKHFAGSLLRYKPSSRGEKILNGFFKDVCALLASLPRVLCHRDYHSQNLVPRRDTLYITDFQDARLGPHVYDLVSLLRDSYLELSDALRARLLLYYIECHPEFGHRDANALSHQFDLMSLQRHLKHLGTFGYQAEMGRNDFLRFVPRTLDYLEANLPKFPQYGEASDVLHEMFERARTFLSAREES